MKLNFSNLTILNCFFFHLLQSVFELIGNPGAGKSTILSSLSGHHFDHGISFGKGLLPKLKMEDDNFGRNIRWCDTADLGDVCKWQAKMAAKPIQDAIDEAQKNDRGTACFKLMNILKYRNI